MSAGGSLAVFGYTFAARIALLIIHGIYRFHPKRVAFRNDYCRTCVQSGRSVQVRTFDAAHVFWIPVLPLGYRKRWLCTICGHSPHIYRGTRRGFKWAGFAVLLFLAAFSWAAPLEQDASIFTWSVRVAAPIGALLVFVHLRRTPKDPSLPEILAVIPAASDSICPFCGTPLLVLSSRCSCPACGVARV
jgi:hypothetical protein